jgi:phenylpropionate dioxygenase-like ring-hydroxylating dioxygenase large terminal subunit
MESIVRMPATGRERAEGTPEYAQLIQDDRIHSSLYTSQAVFDDELRRIFYGGWVYVGHESEVPDPGDYVTRTIGLEPVVLIRNREGAIRVLSNRCSHRGNTVCRAEQGTAKVLTCDYHGWTFSLDGDLLGVPFPLGHCKAKAQLGLASPSRTQSYRGFVFATFNPRSVSLEEHLGKGMALIDQAVAMSPLGKIRLSAGWVKQHAVANWKMLPENATDGYHATTVHSSFFRVFSTQYDAALADEKKRVGEVKDWGGGHVGLNFAPRYTRPLEWMGISAAKVPGYVQQMVEVHGEAKADELLTEGPPHATIFPNLFLGETNIVMFQPLSPHECVQWHTPMLLEGVDEAINTRLIRQSEGAMGPSAFLLADDGVISERQQVAMRGRPAWLELSRGLQREESKDGVITSHSTDEVNNRGFWRHYRSVMRGDAA